MNCEDRIEGRASANNEDYVKTTRAPGENVPTKPTVCATLTVSNWKFARTKLNDAT